MSLTNWQSIIEFHEKFGIEKPDSVTHLPRDVESYRIDFMREELNEYIKSTTLEDKVDALIDLVVVAMGTAYMHGFDWEPHWEEVYRANMAKKRASHASESKRNHSLDIVKPAGWEPPKHAQYFKNGTEE